MDPALSSKLKQRQLHAYATILNWMVWIVGSVALIVTIMALIAGVSARFLVLSVGMSSFAGSIAVGRLMLKRNQIVTSFLLLLIPMFMVALSLSFLFRDASYVVFMATVVGMLIAGLIISPRTTLWIAAGGLLLFVPIALTAQIGLFDQWYAEAGALDDFITVIIGSAAIVVINMLAFILNNVLLKALKEAEQRGVVAETARAEQAITLTQVQQQATDQARLLELVRDLETPVIPLLEGVLVLPVVGHLDTQRMTSLTTALLEQVHQRRAHTVLVDLTGVTIIDTGTANHLIHMAQAIKLLGARVILTGIKAEVAQTLITLGISLSHITTAASLQAGIRQVTDEVPVTNFALNLAQPTVSR